MKLGACELIEKIAEGSLAEIYLAKAPTKSGDEKCLVCKCVRPAVAGDSEFYDSIMVELECAGPLRHPNVVTIYNFCVDNGNAFLTMEYLDAKDFRYLINAMRSQNQNVPYPIAIHIICEIAKGLHAVHELKDSLGNPKQIVHRDITPENIFFNSDGHIKLGDFGIAKAAGRLTATPPDIIRGKFNYLSPEQAWCDSLDRRSDLYALGIIFYEAVLGVPFYRSEAIDQIINEARCGMHVAPIKVDPSFPPELNAILEKLFDIDKTQRYQTALELRDALLSFARSNHCEVSPQEWINFLRAHVPVTPAPLSLMDPDEMAPDPSIFINPELSDVKYDENGFAASDGFTPSPNASMSMQTFETNLNHGSAPSLNHGSAPSLNHGSAPSLSPSYSSTPSLMPPGRRPTPSNPISLPGRRPTPSNPVSLPSGFSAAVNNPMSMPSGRPTPNPISLPFASSPSMAEPFSGAATVPLAEADQFKHLFTSSTTVNTDMPSGTELAVTAMPDDDEMDNIPTACSDVVETVPEQECEDPEYDLLTNDFSSLPDLESGTDTIPMEAPTPELLNALQQQFRAKIEAQLPEPSEFNETVPLINTNDYKDILQQPQSNAEVKNIKFKVNEPTHYNVLEDQQDSFQIFKNGHIQPQIIIIIFLIIVIAGMLGFLLAMMILK